MCRGQTNAAAGRAERGRAADIASVNVSARSAGLQLSRGLAHSNAATRGLQIGRAIHIPDLQRSARRDGVQAGIGGLDPNAAACGLEARLTGNASYRDAAAH